MSVSWFQHSRKVVDKAFDEGQAKGLSGSELKRFVNSHYPFGERAMHPYKMWLKAMREKFPPPKPDRNEPLFDVHPFLVMPKKGNS